MSREYWGTIELLPWKENKDRSMARTLHKEATAEAPFIER